MKTCIGCGKPAGFHVIRGLCSLCYARLSRQVNAGATTWQALEAEGKCHAPKKMRIKMYSRYRVVNKRLT